MGIPVTINHAHDHADRDHEHGGHSHSHSHAPHSFGAAFAIGTALNVAFIAAEVVYGVLANSMALLADAGHNLGDVLGLAMAWVATVLVKRRPTARYTASTAHRSLSHFSTRSSFL